MWEEKWKRWERWKRWNKSWKVLGEGRIGSWPWYLDESTKTDIWEKDRVKEELHRSSGVFDQKLRSFLNHEILWGLAAKKGINCINKFVGIVRNTKLEKTKRLKESSKEAGQIILAPWFEEWLWST